MPPLFPIAAIAGLLFSKAVNAQLPSQLPAQPAHVKTIVSPGGLQIRYKQPTFCETTPGVNTYSGYIDLDKDHHYYFLFYESRSNPKDDPITVWLTGGPGSDSLLAAYVEHGPCFVTTDDLKPVYNTYSWNNVSNVLYLSQPMGTGWSYSQSGPGTIDKDGNYQPPSVNGTKGAYPIYNFSTDDNTTPKAAVSAWNIIQALYTALPQLDAKLQSRSFNLWTESYGGHYGPIFYDYFYNQSQAIKNGHTKGVELEMHSLGIGNGIFDFKVQAPYYLEFSVNNTYGIVNYNETVYNYGKFALNNPGGCLPLIDSCRDTTGNTPIDEAMCADAEVVCRQDIEDLYYDFGNRSPYDVRANRSADVPPVKPLKRFLNQAQIQDQSAVALNWTMTNIGVSTAFERAGDYQFPTTIPDLAHLLDSGVRVSLYAGDADYICNWLGNEAVSLQIPYSQISDFRAAGYAPFLLDGAEVGAVRQHGNFSFVRVYNAGHQVPYFQPAAALALFNRTISNVDIATGKVPVTNGYSTKGSSTSTFREA